MNLTHVAIDAVAIFFAYLVGLKLGRLSESNRRDRIQRELVELAILEAEEEAWKNGEDEPDYRIN